MRRFFTFLVFMLALSMSSWAGILFFPEKLVDFPTGVEPEEVNGSKYYRQYVWWYWSDDMSDTPFALSDYEADFIWSVDVTGDITIPEGKYLTKDGNHYELSSSEIFFNGTSGTITMTATQPDFNGMPYSASYTINYHVLKSKKWDFNTKPYKIKDWSFGAEQAMSTPAEDHWKYHPYTKAISSSDNAGNIIEEAAGLQFVTAANCFGSNNPGANHDVEKWNNKTNKWETYNNPDKDANVETRFICLKAGSKLIIPASIFSTWSKPRVRIKMNRDAEKEWKNNEWVASTTLNLKVTNATDAVGTTCNQTNGWYGIGGSAWWGRDKGDYLYRGEYHFQIIDPSQNFSIEVPKASDYVNGDDAWLLIYTIEVYDSQEMITENDVLGSCYQFLTTEKTTVNEQGAKTTTTTVTDPAAFWVHYRGKGEHSTVSNCSTSGTVGTLGQANVNGGNFVSRFASSGGSDTKHTYTPVAGEFGSFRMRLEVHDHNNNYITDYAYRTQSVGLMQNKIYPYTWDFTDIATYQTDNFRDDNAVVTDGTKKMGLESGPRYAVQDPNDYVHGVIHMPRNVWDTDGHFRIANNGGHDVLYCGGSQLWYGETIIPESAGLAFTPVNYDGAYNGAMTLTNNGLLFNQSLRDWWLWRVTIPQVDTQSTIYVRARKLSSDELAGSTYYNVGYCYCYVDDGNTLNLWNGDATNKTPKTSFSTAALTATATAREIATDGDDVIYAIPAPSQTTNVTLFFQGVEVHKIAVSKDPKTVNKYGWATESRDHVIDQSLTSYFTGKNFVTYLVSAVNDAKTSVSLTEVNMNQKVMKKSQIDSQGNADYNAYIIRNKDAKIQTDETGAVVTDENGEVVATGKVDILKTGGGFHLFVPDIHDYIKDNENYPSSDNRYNQKTLNSYKPLLRAQLGQGTVYPTETINGVDYTNFVLTWQVADVEHGQQNPDDYDFGNVGFFRVQDSGVQSRGNQGYLPLILGSGNTTNKYSIVWDDETNGIDATITDNVAVRNDNVFYNLSGQRLNGVPTKGGIYIVNGKKIVVK